MKSTQRTKEELAQSLWNLYKEISSLNETTNLPQNSPLKEKLNAHSPRWNGLYRELVAESFLFAKKLTYNYQLYKRYNIKSTDKDEKRSKAEQLVAHCTEPLMKVVFRRFSVQDFTGDFEEFIKTFENDLKGEFNKFASKEFDDNRRVGTGLSEKNKRIVRHYLRVKESLEKVSKDRANLSEVKVQTLYLQTSNHYGITEKKLQTILKAYFQTLVQSEFVQDEDDDNENSLFDFQESRDFSGLNKEAEQENQNFIHKLLEAMEKVYRKRQKRAQEYFSALMTQWFLEQIKTWNYLNASFIKYFSNFSFMDKDLLNHFECSGEVPDRQMVLERFPVKKGDKIVLDKNGKPKYKDKGRASNDMKNVLNELKEILSSKKNVN
ncbi:MAG: hypothetical protein J6R67_09155 [Treponema sp.]|nr:hypothetical protein [Treponema sp.]